MAKSHLTNQNKLIFTATITVGKDMMFEFVPLQFLTNDAIMLQMNCWKWNSENYIWIWMSDSKSTEEKLREKESSHSECKRFFFSFFLRSSFSVDDEYRCLWKFANWNNGYAIQCRRWNALKPNGFRNDVKNTDASLGGLIFDFFGSFRLIQLNLHILLKHNNINWAYGDFK